MTIFLITFIFVSIPTFADWEKIISIPYYSTPSTEPDWTGPAAAKMILESPIIMAEPSYVMKTQGELWTYINSHSIASWDTYYPGVHTDPVAMRECLKEYDTRQPFTYGIFATPTYDAIVSQKIVETIATYDVPPAVPIDGGLNWVAVQGVHTSDPPLLPGTYSIDWFLINDPRDPVIGNNRFISYENWENGSTSVFLHIQTPSPFPDNWLKMAVCDPETPGPLKIKGIKAPPRREIVLTPGEARDAAVKGLKKYNLLDRPGFENALQRIKSGKPILVRRMSGRVRADYYIVPMVKRHFIFWKRLTGAILIDAYSGAILETSIAKKPICYPYLSRSLARSRNLLIKKIRKTEGLRNRELNVGMPTLTWKPGLSVNPYFPLWKTRASIKGVAQTRYLDFNGKVLNVK